MVHFTSMVKAPCLNLILLLYKERAIVSSIRCRSNWGKERTGASWKLEMLLLAEDSPGLPETEPAWAPGAASGCDSGPTLSLQGWDCHCVPARMGQSEPSSALLLVLCCLRARLGPGAGPAQPLSPGWDGEQPGLPG